MSGFKWAYEEGGGTPLVTTEVVKNDAVLTEFCILNFESGEVDLAATNDSALFGISLEALDNAADGLTVRVLRATKNSVFQVVDANVRTIGETLDIGSGALTVAASSNVDLVVVRTSSATEPTYVKFASGEIWAGVI
jgi:hypothetical protein